MVLERQGEEFVDVRMCEEQCADAVECCPQDSHCGLGGGCVGSFAVLWAVGKSRKNSLYVQIGTPGGSFRLKTGGVGETMFVMMRSDELQIPLAPTDHRPSRDQLSPSTRIIRLA
jgi:hypothetical protein